MVALLFGLSVLLADGPVFQVHASGLTVHIPANFLRNEAVKKNLKSGLTTSLDFGVVLHSSDMAKHTATVHVFIRYELWDEVFLVEYMDYSGRHEVKPLADLKKLASWFETQPFLLLGGAPLDDNSLFAEITLRVMPFSQREQKKAQKWMSRRVSSQQNKTGGSQNHRQVMDLIIGTSVKRPALYEFSWEMEITGGVHEF